MKFNLYFRNLTQEVYAYVLRQAGWNSLTEFELEARFADSVTFHASNQLQGLCSPEAPEWDSSEVRYKTFTLSLHHLRKNIRKYILQYLGFHTYIDYVVTYGMNDTFFIHVPCREDVMWEQEHDQEEDNACEIANETDDKTVEQHDSLPTEAMEYASQLVGSALMRSPPNIQRVLPPPPPLVETNGQEPPSIVRDSYFGVFDDYDTMDDLETQPGCFLTPKQCPDDIQNHT